MTKTIQVSIDELSYRQVTCDGRGLWAALSARLTLAAWFELFGRKRYRPEVPE